MSKSKIASLLLGASVLAIGLPAWAQSADQGTEAVTVTGSRVARQGFEAPTPTTAIGSVELEQKAALTVTDIIAEIPSLAPNQNNNNSQNIGLSTFNLRNIGPTRTLVLIDGMRVEDTSPTGGFNVNVIPAQLISHIDIVTGGASAAYGSDGITGVVNVSLAPQMTGGKIDLQATGSNYGDDHALAGSLTYGHGFAGNKGQFVFAASYYNQPHIIYEARRPWGRQGWTQFTNTKAAVAAGAPTYTIGPGGTLAEVTSGGVMIVPQKNGSATQFYQFLAGGVLAPFNQGSLCGATNYCQNGDGVATSTQPTSAPGGVLLPKAERYNLYTHLTYDLTPSIQLFGSVLFSSDTETGTNVPNYNNGDLKINTDNYYLLNSPNWNPASPTAYNIRNILTAANGGTLPASFNLGRENFEDGSTVNAALTTYMRYNAGVQGTLSWGSGWSWDAHVTYTQSLYYNQSANNRIQTNFFNAVDAVANPATGGVPGVPVGQPVCRSSLTAPTNGCVPINVFGPGTISQSGLNYYRGTSYVRDGDNQFNFGGNLRGDLFSTWAGPISAAIGGEYRRDSINQTSDAVSHVLGWRQASAQPFYGANEVREGYVEFVTPLTIPNMPLMQKLEVDTAGRIADYDSSGAAFVYKAGLNWTLIDDIRVRATYSRDFRAPSVNDLYSTPLISNGTVVRDSVQTINGAANPNFQGSPTIQTLSGGNPKLKPETAKTFTAGVVLSPRFFPGFTTSIDYYNIDMGNALTTFSAQNVVDNCAAGSAVFCGGITRNAANVITVVQSSQFNAQTLKVSGVDFEASYAFSLHDVWDELEGSLAIGGLASYAEHITTTANNIIQENAGFLTSFGGTNYSMPNWRTVTSMVYSNGPLTMRLLWDYTGAGRYAPTLKTAADINPYHFDGRSLFDLSTQYQVTDELQVYAKINNVLNTDPPLIANNATLKALADSSSLYPEYDLGRVFGIGVRYTWQ
jgi:outer membrane receptor protein involved in Fe transport